MALRSIRSFVSDWLPPAVRRLHRRWFRWRWFRGDYPDWTTAQGAAAGYDQPAILERVLAAALAVRDGRAAFERDGVTFAEPQCDEGLLAALEHVALASRGRLRVLDFGGSLGSTWIQLRPFWPRAAQVRWNVVEQPHFVAAGRSYLRTDELDFHESIAAARMAGEPDVALVSCVVQYLEAPHRFVDELVAHGLPFLVFNNLMLHDGSDRLTVQHTPPEIYPASYPVWFLNRDRFFARFAGRYRVVFEFASSAVWEVDGRPLAGRGCLLVREPEVRG